MNALKCCHLECNKDAEFTIRAMGPGVDYFDITQACEQHVGSLLGSITETPADHWVVLPDLDPEFPIECVGPRKGACFLSHIGMNCNLRECARAAYDAEGECSAEKRTPWEQLGCEQDLYAHMALGVVLALRYLAGGDEVCRVKNRLPKKDIVCMSFKSKGTE